MRAHFINSKRAFSDIITMLYDNEDCLWAHNLDQMGLSDGSCNFDELVTETAGPLSDIRDALLSAMM